MAASLRHPLSALIWLAMAAVYLPLVPAAAMLLTPALSAGNWQRLFDDPQIPQALAATGIHAGCHSRRPVYRPDFRHHALAR